MKSLIKLTLAFALGILVTVTVILPKLQVSNEPAPTSDIQAEIKQAVDSAVIAALASVEKAEPVEVQAEQEPVVNEPEETPEPKAESVQEAMAAPEATPTPTVEPQKTQPTSTPQEKKPEPAEPEYFYEDGKKYTYINGFKSLISDEPDGEIETYDWESDPLGKVKGPFN